MYSLLIADDIYEIRNGLANYIPWKSLGFEIVDSVEDGKKALKIIQSRNIDVLLCDIKMPVMNGIELAEYIHKNIISTKVVLLSAFRDFEYAQNAIKFGVDRYILKPTKYEELHDIFSGIRDELDSKRHGNSSQPAVDPGLCNEVIHTVKTFVETNICKASLENAAEQVHMNPNYLSRYYKEKTGECFSDFLIRTKLEKAILLLKDFSYLIYQVSDKVGYQSPRSFSRAFKRYSGKTPGEYRDLLIQGQIPDDRKIREGKWKNHEL